MSTQWQPGDVGVNVEHGYRSIYVESCRIAEHGRGGGACWHNESGHADPPSSARQPLVVIDPEDTDQIARLVRSLIEVTRDPGVKAYLPDLPYADVKAALREFANPKPPKCPAVLHVGRERIECERDDGYHSSDHRNDSIGQGVRWSK